MRIGELAIRTGVSVRALRYYEEQTLLMAERSPRGQRQYGEDAVERVELIQQLYAAGLSSKIIIELLPHVVDDHATPELLRRLAAERVQVDQAVAELSQTRERLDSVISAASDNLSTGQSCGRKERH